MHDTESIAAFVAQYSAHLLRWKTDLTLESPPAPEYREPQVQRTPCIDVRHLRPAPEQVQRLLIELLTVLRESFPDGQMVMARLESSARDGVFSGPALLRHTLDQDEIAVDLLAERLAVPTQIVRFVQVFFARPFYLAARRGPDAADVETAVETDRAPATCPCCGREPALAVFMPESGQRRLWCRYCALEWPVPRLWCSYCGNTEATTLGYFTLEQESGRRVDYCETCRRYIKTFDLRTLAQHADASGLDLADLLNGDLDLMAVREGFLPLVANDAAADWRRSGGEHDHHGGKLS